MLRVEVEVQALSTDELAVGLGELCIDVVGFLEVEHWVVGAIWCGP